MPVRQLGNFVNLESRFHGETQGSDGQQFHRNPETHGLASDPALQRRQGGHQRTEKILSPGTAFARVYLKWLQPLSQQGCNRTLLHIISNIECIKISHHSLQLPGLGFRKLRPGHNAGCCHFLGMQSVIHPRSPQSPLPRSGGETPKGVDAVDNVPHVHRPTPPEKIPWIAPGPEARFQQGNEAPSASAPRSKLPPPGLEPQR